MRTIRGEYLLLIGFLMMVVGIILPFLMVTKVIESTFFLNFFSYFLQVGGLFMGIVGVGYLVSYRKSKNKGMQPPPDAPPNNHHDW
jgi:hypothetical protein